jgi:hypothetical protein
MAMVFTDAKNLTIRSFFANDSFVSLAGYDREEVLAQSFDFPMARHGAAHCCDRLSPAALPRCRIGRHSVARRNLSMEDRSGSIASLRAYALSFCFALDSGRIAASQQNDAKGHKRSYPFHRAPHPRRSVCVGVPRTTMSSVIFHCTGDLCWQFRRFQRMMLVRNWSGTVVMLSSTRWFLGLLSF